MTRATKISVAREGEPPSVNLSCQAELQERETTPGPATSALWPVGTKVLWECISRDIPGTIEHVNDDGTYDIKWTYGGADKHRNPEAGKSVKKDRIQSAPDTSKWLTRLRNRETDLKGADFRFENLTDIDFVGPGYDLTDARFDGCEIVRSFFGLIGPTGHDESRRGSFPKLDGATFWCATLTDVDFVHNPLKGVKFGDYLCGAILIGVNFWAATMNDVKLRNTTLEEVNFHSTKMEAKVDVEHAKIIDCDFTSADLAGMEFVEAAQFAPADVPKPKKRVDKPVTGLIALFMLAWQDAMHQLTEDILEEYEIDSEADDDDDDGAAGGDVNDADDDKVELECFKDIGAQGVKLLTTWLMKQGRKSFATLEAQINKLAAKADKFKQALIDERRQAQVDGDVSKAIAKIERDVAKAIAKMRAVALTRALERETANDLNGKIATLRKVLTIKATQMAKELNDIEYLLTALEKAQEPFTKTTWSDTVESWFGMCNLIKKLDSERAQHVLDCIFSDEDVLEALGRAVVFKDIADPDAVPSGVLVKLKAGPGKHIKDRYYEYVKALKTETAHIERLQSLQKQAKGLIALVTLAMLTGVGNFVVGLFANKLFYGEWVPDQQV